MRPHTGWYAIPSHASSIKVCNSLSAIPFRTVILWVEKALGSKTPHLHNTREAKPTQRMHMMYMLCICRCSLHVQYVPQARQSTRRCCYCAVPTMSPVHLWIGHVLHVMTPGRLWVVAKWHHVWSRGVCICGSERPPEAAMCQNFSGLRCTVFVVSVYCRIRQTSSEFYLDF